LIGVRCLPTATGAAVDAIRRCSSSRSARSSAAVTGTAPETPRGLRRFARSAVFDRGDERFFTDAASRGAGDDAEDFSADAVQTFAYISDGGNEVMWIFNHADALNGSSYVPPIGGFGQPGHQAGQFTFLHMMAIDSKGNLYAGETIGGRRVQKFIRCPGNGQGGNSQGNGNGCPINNSGG